jgi:hypothetical protein
MNLYDSDKTQWDAAKHEGKAILSGYAKRRDTVSYTNFVNEIHSIQFDAYDFRLFELLGEISRKESAEGRGMLSALVVHKRGDGLPGPGFFELAQQLGYDTKDIVKFWIEEVKRVYDVWSKL